MFKELYPEAKKILLINNTEEKIPNINLYQTNIKLNELQNILNKEKELVKEVYEYNIRQHKILGSKKFNELKKIKIFQFTKNLEEISSDFINPKGWSNAYRKMYEVCVNYNFIPKNKVIRHFDICSFPGSFLFAVNDFIKTKNNNKEVIYDFYFQSYVNNDKEKGSYFDDRYKLAKKYKNRFIAKNNGDITKINEINHYQNFFKNKKCNIVTSDCGLENRTTNNYEREKQMTKIFLGQFLAGLVSLKKNGNFLMKYYHFYSIFNLSLIYLMGLLFKKVYLVKPISSRQITGKEIYIMCVSFKDNLSDKKIEELKNVLKSFKDEDIDKTIINEKNINKKIFQKLEKKLSEYFNYKILRNKLKYEIVEKYIGISWEDNYNKYVNKLKKIKKISDKMEREFLLQFLENMNYIKVDKDKEL